MQLNTNICIRVYQNPLCAVIVLLLLGLGWGGFSYYVLYFITLDGATQYPSIKELLPYAILPTLPLLAGAFVVNLKKGCGRYMRWLCAVLLLPQAAALFYATFSFFMLVALPPFLGALLLLRMEIAWLFNQVHSLVPLGLRLKLIQLRIPIALVGIGISGMLLGYHWTHNSLESDAEMIAHFKAHREDFEYLVNGFRTLPENASIYDTSGWSESPEIQAIKKRSNIQYVNQGELIAPTKLNIQTIIDEGKYNKNTMVNIILETQINSRHSSLHFCVGMRKLYVNFPIAPSIEQGYLLFPWDKEEIPAKKQLKRVADSLDGYPSGLKEQGCVYRRIEAHWFIELCGACK